MRFRDYDAPCGRLLLAVHGQHICLCDWIIGPRIETTMRRIKKYIPAAGGPDDESLFILTARLLDEYFAGSRMEFNLPLIACGSEFQRRVWEALLQVPYGHTASYRNIAESIGHPQSVRAVASAIGANPLSILIPCHRIIGSDGSLTGYAGGLGAKRYLLRLESPA